MLLPLRYMSTLLLLLAPRLTWVLSLKLQLLVLMQRGRGCERSSIPVLWGSVMIGKGWLMRGRGQQRSSRPGVVLAAVVQMNQLFVPNEKVSDVHISIALPQKRRRRESTRQRAQVK